MSLKIIAGEYKNSKLVDFADKNVRPSKALIRDAGLNMIGARRNLTDIVHACDLCSGTGALGIEALSRGVQHVTFVDTNTAHTRQNLEQLGIPTNRYTLVQQEVTTFRPTNPFDVILADPPYSQGIAQTLLQNAEYLGKNDTLWLLEEEKSASLNVPATLTLLKHKKHGRNALWLLTQA